MERILVALDPGRTSIWTIVHGINLGKRVSGRVYILIISKKNSSRSIEKHINSDVQKRVESLIDEARSEGLFVDLYVTHGSFDHELIKFIKENKISLLILGVPVSSKEGSLQKFLKFAEKIRQRVDCRIEIVNEKGVKIARKRSE